MTHFPHAANPIRLLPYAFSFPSVHRAVKHSRSSERKEQNANFTTTIHKAIRQSVAVVPSLSASLPPPKFCCRILAGPSPPVLFTIVAVSSATTLYRRMMGSLTQNSRDRRSAGDVGPIGLVGCDGISNLACIAWGAFGSLVRLVVAVECRKLRVLFGVLSGRKVTALAIAANLHNDGANFGFPNISSMIEDRWPVVTSDVEGSSDCKIDSRIRLRRFHRLRPIPLPRVVTAATPISHQLLRLFLFLDLVERLVVGYGSNFVAQRAGQPQGQIVADMARSLPDQD